MRAFPLPVFFFAAAASEMGDSEDEENNITTQHKLGMLGKYSFIFIET